MTMRIDRGLRRLWGENVGRSIDTPRRETKSGAQERPWKGERHGGDRLPWIRGGDNFARLTAPVWQAHIYGTPHAGLSAWCAAHNLPLQIFGWKPAYEAAGLGRDALYLLRLDTYVALADPAGSPAILQRYCTERGLRLD